jgi:putative ATP-dependent endonuclease of the OLD family
MKLTSVEVRDFRSIFADDVGGGLSLPIGDGATVLVGPNNCGKSNVLRAIAIALDPQRSIGTEDIPGPRPYAHPEITLDFHSDGSHEETRLALEAARAYEQSLGISAERTRAARGQVTLRVSFSPSADGIVRSDVIVTDDQRGPLTPEQSTAHVEALDSLRRTVEFVLISSGESIESVLAGNFRAILHNVVRERLAAEFESAETSRLSYISGLEESLLAPLRDRLLRDVAELFPEIDAIGLTPEVHTIERTLSNVAVSLDDVVTTPLAGKGTGVRGGLLVAMLSYLASGASRNLIFALEEPEAFLHPAAQEQLRDNLDLLATNAGITLLVTTHSPFILSRSPAGQIVCLVKDREGRTRISASAAGDADHAPLVGGLLREQTLEDLLKASSAVPPGIVGMLLVEGDGDRLCLELAARIVGRPDLLEGISIRPTGGTIPMALNAIVARAANPNLPLLILIDNDEPGRKLRALLTGETFLFSKKQIISYASLFPEGKWQQFPVEAEDLFPASLIERFVKIHGESIIDGSKKRPDDAFHYDLNQAAKRELEGFLSTETQPQDVSAWIELILRLRKQFGLEGTETADEIVAAAPTAAPSAVPNDGDALIVANGLDLAMYSRHGAIVMPSDQPVPESVTHVGFYSAGEISAIVPSVLAHHQRILIAPETADQLRQTGRPNDEVVARAIESLLEVTGPASDAQRLLVLTPPDDPRTIELDRPIRNTKVHNGRPLAWTVGNRTVSVASLRTAPSTTDELDARQHEEATA